MDFPWKYQKKLDTQMPQIKHRMSVLYGSFHENVKKELDTQMSQITHPMSVLYGFSIETSKKKLDTQISGTSIRCHFYMDFAMKM